MDPSTTRLVPKLHPTSRSVEPDDPMTLNAIAVEGDPNLMIRAVVQEYSWMGWSPDRIMGLFRDPFYPVLNELWRLLGEAEVRSRVDSVVGEFGIYQFRSTIVEAPEVPGAFAIEDLLLDHEHESGPLGFDRGRHATSDQSPRDPSFVSLEAFTASLRKREGGDRE